MWILLLLLLRLLLLLLLLPSLKKINSVDSHIKLFLFAEFFSLKNLVLELQTKVLEVASLSLLIEK